MFYNLKHDRVEISMEEAMEFKDAVVNETTALVQKFGTDDDGKVLEFMKSIGFLPDTNENNGMVLYTKRVEVAEDELDAILSTALCDDIMLADDDDTDTYSDDSVDSYSDEETVTQSDAIRKMSEFMVDSARNQLELVGQLAVALRELKDDMESSNGKFNERVTSLESEVSKWKTNTVIVTICMIVQVIIYWFIVK